MDNIRSNTANPPPPDNAPLVCAIAYDGLCTFEFGIAVELFALPRPEFSNWYRFLTVRAAPGPIRATGGFTVDALHDLDVLRQASLIIIPGWSGIDVPVPSDLCDALRAAHARGARIGSICSGVFVLAAAGLLDGQTATTHWRYADILAQRFPRITVDPDVLYVEGNGVYSSAGSAAGLDLGLHIIRQDFGAKAAASVARRLVLPAQRDGGQRQFVPRPAAKVRIGSNLASLLDQIRMALDQDWTVARMAKMAGTSARSLARRFHEDTGVTPIQWLTRERLARAAELLEDPGSSLSDICAACGFGSDESFRRRFRMAMGVPPVKYRERMAMRGQAASAV